jgi:hypothetical protein
MNFTKTPSLREFTDFFNEYVKEVGVMDNHEGWIGSHKIVGRISVAIEDEDDDTDLEIVGIEYDQLMGCGCLSDVIIKVRKVK